VRPGHLVHFDNGRISGVVEQAGPDRIDVRITPANPRGSRLPAARGINLPDTELPIPALTAFDRAALTTAVGIADIVGLRSSAPPPTSSTSCASSTPSGTGAPASCSRSRPRRVSSTYPRSCSPRCDAPGSAS
jgi:hypothetical protein